MPQVSIYMALNPKLILVVQIPLMRPLHFWLQRQYSLNSDVKI